MLPVGRPLFRDQDLVAVLIDFNFLLDEVRPSFFPKSLGSPLADRNVRRHANLLWTDRGDCFFVAFRNAANFSRSFRSSESRFTFGHDSRPSGVVTLLVRLTLIYTGKDYQSISYLLSVCIVKLLILMVGAEGFEPSSGSGVSLNMACDYAINPAH